MPDITPAPRRRPLWRLFIMPALVLIGAIACSGFWFYAASEVGVRADAWRAQEAKAGRVYDCARRSVGGFPFRLEVSCEDASVTLVSQTAGAGAPFTAKLGEILVVAQIYDPKLLIAEFTAPATISDRGGQPSMVANWRTARSSVVGLPAVPQRVALAVGNFATLYLAGRPWGITSAFALWGSKIFAASGIDVASWGYWHSAERAKQLQESVFADITSVMDFGIILGALLASGLAGKFSPGWKVPPRSLIAAVIGGLLLGYGARLAYGCNIGAYFSGIASSSLHGWLWLVAAFIGSIFGTYLRPLFGLSVEGNLARAQAGPVARD